MANLTTQEKIELERLKRKKARDNSLVDDIADTVGDVTSTIAGLALGSLIDPFDFFS